MYDLKGKVALVTGGGSGIGQATALLLSELGAKIAVADISAEGGQATVQMIQSSGGDAFFIPCDVSKSSQVHNMVSQTVSRLGGLDYAINNAGGTNHAAILTDTSEEYWQHCIGVHLTGVWLCMKAEIHHMMNHGGGAIVNISSVSGLLGAKGGSAYTAAKHGVLGLTKTAALEYAQNNIRVNAVCPSVIYTPIVQAGEKANPELVAKLRNTHAMKRFGNPREVATSIVWLCSDGASFITGACLPVDGGVVAGIS